jgi:hypothetical protein
MSTRLAREQMLVIDGHVIRAELDEANRPESISIEVVVDGRRLRGWEEPGWREIGFGAAPGMFFWWSARRVVRVDLEVSVQVADEVTYDEDVLLALVMRFGLLIVGETSVSVLSDGAVVSRLELDDVIAGGYLDGGDLVVEMFDGRSFRVAVECGDLRLEG